MALKKFCFFLFQKTIKTKTKTNLKHNLDTPLKTDIIANGTKFDLLFISISESDWFNHAWKDMALLVWMIRLFKESLQYKEQAIYRSHIKPDGTVL